MAVVDRTDQMVKSRQVASEHKRSLVLAVVSAQLGAGKHPSIAGIARQAGVGRKFIYDHPDLRAEIDLAIARSTAQERSDLATRSRVSAASLRAELENTREHNRRLVAQVRALEVRLSRADGAQLVADDLLPGNLVAELADEKLGRQVAELDRQLFDAKEELRHNIEELEAARVINRELMQRLNQPTPHGR